MRIDLHSHAGRCFLAGLSDRHPMVGVLGPPTVAESLQAAARAGMDAIWLSTVADLAVLSVDSSGGLRANRNFAAGEAWADHRRQLAGLRDAVTAAEAATTVMLACEGADFLEGDLARLDDVVRQGVSMLTLVHYRVNELGDVQTEAPVHGGLTAFGREVVAECNRLQVVIDCAHASLATTMDVLETSRDPVVVSHSHLGCAGDHPRLLSSEHAAAVARSGGLIGAWPAGVACRSLTDFGDEILRLIDTVGAEHVAIGTDLDGNYRPVLTDYRQFDEVAEHLSARGLDAGDVANVLGGNAAALLARIRG